MYALNLTPVFNELLKKNEGGSTAKTTGDLSHTDGFLKEAYRINGHIATLAQQLRDVRQAYLSTAPPRRSTHRKGTAAAAATTTTLTDAQREEVDANAKRLLRDLNASIRALADAEALHQETQQALVRKRFAGPSVHLGRLSLLPLPQSAAAAAEQAAAEEALRQTATHRESVLWYLRQRLQACGLAQQTMMEARVARMARLVEMTAASSYVAALQEEEAAQGRQERHERQASAPEQAGLTQEQLQMFERGNQDMVKYYETTLDKVRAAEQSLVEISELQTMLVSNLELQAAHVDQMVVDSVNTAENVARGNVELKKALDRPSTARFTFYAASGLCLFVVVWDFFV